MNTQVRTHLVVGEFDEVAAMMQTARDEGRLVRVTWARDVGEGLVEVIAEFREPVESIWPERLWLRIALGLLGLAVVGGLVWLLVWAVMALISTVAAVVAWLSAHLAAIALGAGALVLLACWLGGSRCEGLHCGGCRR